MKMEEEGGIPITKVKVRRPKRRLIMRIRTTTTATAAVFLFVIMSTTMCVVDGSVSSNSNEYQPYNRQPPPDFCKKAGKQNVNDVIPDPNDCAAVIWCRDQEKPSFKECPPGNQFNVEKNMCDDERNVDCRKGVVSIRKIDHQKFNNSKFYLPKTYMLPDKVRLDLLTRKKVLKAKMEQYHIDICKNEKKKETDFEVHPDPKDCFQFILCTKNKTEAEEKTDTVVKRCIKGTRFVPGPNKKKINCEKTTATTCDNIRISTNEATTTNQGENTHDEDDKNHRTSTQRAPISRGNKISSRPSLFDIKTTKKIISKAKIEHYHIDICKNEKKKETLFEVHPDPKDCFQFILCTKTTTVVKRCIKGTRFVPGPNKMKINCEKTTATTCDNIKISTNEATTTNQGENTHGKDDKNSRKSTQRAELARGNKISSRPSLRNSTNFNNRKPNQNLIGSGRQSSSRTPFRSSSRNSTNTRRQRTNFIGGGRLSSSRTPFRPSSRNSTNTRRQRTNIIGSGRLSSSRTSLPLSIKNFCEDRGHRRGSYPNPNNCSEYILCFFNMVTKIISCKSGEKFDSVSKECVSASLAKCGTSSTSSTSTNTRRPSSNLSKTRRPSSRQSSRNFCKDSKYRSGRFPHPNICSAYINCLNHTTNIVYCKYGKKYDSVSKDCVSPTLAKCGNGTSRIPEDTKSKTRENESKTVSTHSNVCRAKSIRTGNIAYPNDCSRFIKCRTYVATIITCPLGKIYIPEFKKCDLPAKNVQCINGTIIKNKLKPKLKTKTKTCPRIVCYFDTTSKILQRESITLPKDINGQLCTHVIMMYTAVVHNSKMGYYFGSEKSVMLQMISGLKRQNPNLKILVNIMDYEDKSPNFSKMARTKKNRSLFIKSVISFLKENKDADGIDLFWKYPAIYNRGGKPKDKQSLSNLIIETRKAFDKENKGYLLTAMVHPKLFDVKRAYDVPVLNQNLDFINLLSIELYDDKEIINKTVNKRYPRHHSALKTGLGSRRSLQGAVTNWINKGVDKSLLVPMVPFYGKSYKINDARQIKSLGYNNRMDTNTNTKRQGMRAYFEVCSDRKKQDLIVEEGRNSTSGEYYLTKDNHVVYYDSVASVKAKARFVMDQGLGGVAVVDLNMDDFGGQFCGQGKFPLLTAINNVCHNT